MSFQEDIDFDPEDPDPNFSEQDLYKPTIAFENVFAMALRVLGEDFAEGAVFFELKRGLISEGIAFLDLGADIANYEWQDASEIPPIIERFQYELQRSNYTFYGLIQEFAELLRDENILDLDRIGTVLFLCRDPSNGELTIDISEYYERLPDLISFDLITQYLRLIDYPAKQMDAETGILKLYNRVEQEELLPQICEEVITILKELEPEHADNILFYFKAIGQSLFSLNDVVRFALKKLSSDMGSVEFLLTAQTESNTIIDVDKRLNYFYSMLNTTVEYLELVISSEKSEEDILQMIKENPIYLEKSKLFDKDMLNLLAGEKSRSLSSVQRLALTVAYHLISRIQGPETIEYLKFYKQRLNGIFLPDKKPRGKYLSN